MAKALTILDLLAAHQGDMSLGEIARALDLPKSTLHGLLATLRDFGYLEQSPFDGRYRLGVRLFEIGNIVANNWDVRKVAAPHIQKLVDELEETVHLVVLDKGEVLYIDKRESRQSLRIVSQVGMRLPAHCTGVGKVLLAYLHPSEVKRIIATKGLARYTRHTITDPRQLEAELAKIREMGYAVDNEEIMDSLRCVAAPIRDHNGKVCAAVSVSGPVARLEGEKFRLAVEQVVRTAAEISAGLGYRPAVGSDISGT
ncbi:IclR family transcriptional regulator [Neomoorella humiferrea]|uniref:IclR family transcriptional regulator n=1 Tax=Neomoorella humiferrea TaxID=676965 RepID=UPI003D94E7B8